METFAGFFIVFLASLGAISVQRSFFKKVSGFFEKISPKWVYIIMIGENFLFFLLFYISVCKALL